MRNIPFENTRLPREVQLRRMQKVIRQELTELQRYTLCAVCGVGLGDTGSQTEAVRKTANIPATVPLFTLQGGMDYARLRGVNKWMIDMLTRMLESKTRTPEEEAMLALIRKGGNYVGEAHLTELLAWYEAR